MSLPCPDCMPKHLTDMAQPDKWRDQNGVRAEGWLHPSAEYSALLHCNTCGSYFERKGYASPLRHIAGTELREHRRVRVS